MTEGQGAGRRRGRRPGGTTTRSAILASARALFAEQGYDRTGIREIAAKADVDPALVHHFFGSKEELFSAAMRLPNIPDLVAQVLARDPEALVQGRLGELLARLVLTVWEDKAVQRPALGLLRSALTHPRAAAMLRDFAREAILARIATLLPAPNRELRVSLAASQVVGLLMARHVLHLEPLASASADEVVRAIGPTLQRYLAGDVSGEGRI